MKTTRRHELQTNELADRLSHWIEAVKPYSRAALAVVLAIVVVIFAWSYLSSQSSRKQAEGWNAFFAAMNERDPQESLADIASRYAGSEVASWARVTLADIQTQIGTNQLFAEKGKAKDELRDAAEKYRAVLLETQEPALLQRAMFGLARAHEAQGTPDSLDNARKEYRSIGEKWPDSPYAKDAASRAVALDTAAAKNFYDWVAKYEPPRTMANEPGTPGAKPDFLKDPLEDSGLKVPSAIDDSTPLPKFGDPTTDAPPAAETAPAPTTDAPAADPTATPPAEPPAETPTGEAPSPPTEAPK